jgi:hypothetical protein
MTFSGEEFSTIRNTRVLYYLLAPQEKEYMLRIGEFVLHEKTGHTGIVIGYGHQILGGVYETTLKVLMDYTAALGKDEMIEEDSYLAWIKRVRPQGL